MVTSPNRYLVLDAARVFGELETAKKLQQGFLSLYSGKSEISLSTVAPYLFPCERESLISKWMFENGWQNSWGLLVDSSILIDQLRQHMRLFLKVKTEDGRQLYFRFYDPRVLKIFLPICDKQQIIEFFGPIEKFIVEGNNIEEAIVFSHQNGVLRQEIIPAKEIFGNIQEQIEID